MGRIRRWSLWSWGKVVPSVGGWMQGSDDALRVGRGVVVELIEVRRHKSVGVWHEVPTTTP